MSSAEIVAKEKSVIKNFYNQKFYRVDFSGQDLQRAIFSNASLIECDFSNADLSYATFEGANCRGANFTGTRLYRTNFKDAALAQSKFEPKDAFGMTITLSCETVDGMRIGKLWWFVWIMMCLRMDCPDKDAELGFINAIGAERYEGLARLFSRRIF
jgi:uncharacterized protein YjbI with pentapeptide repeats